MTIDLTLLQHNELPTSNIIKYYPMGITRSDIDLYLHTIHHITYTFTSLMLD